NRCQLQKAGKLSIQRSFTLISIAYLIGNTGLSPPGGKSRTRALALPRRMAAKDCPGVCRPGSVLPRAGKLAASYPGITRQNPVTAPTR
ncbi:MAG: hypothetical protein ACKOAO_05780, partial [Oxalobacteraceae bacterium]